MRRTIITFTAVGLALSLGAAGASAKQRRHAAVPSYEDAVQELPLTVNKRSFLDPGPVAPVGTGTNYVAANTIFNRTPDRNFQYSKFGNESLPGQPYVPGRTVPVAEFSTGPNVGELTVGPVLGLDY